MEELIDICRRVETPESSWPMTEGAIRAATNLYAEAVTFCQRAEFPLSSIRVYVASTGLWEAKLRKKTAALETNATVLLWDGRAWSAARQVREGGYSTRGDSARAHQGMAWAEFDYRPAPMFEAKKRRGLDIFNVTIALISGHRTQIRDPWTTEVRRQHKIAADKQAKREARAQAAESKRTHQKRFSNTAALLASAVTSILTKQGTLDDMGPPVAAAAIAWDFISKYEIMANALNDREIFAKLDAIQRARSLRRQRGSHV